MYILVVGADASKNFEVRVCSLMAAILALFASTFAMPCFIRVETWALGGGSGLDCDSSMAAIGETLNLSKMGKIEGRWRAMEDLDAWQTQSLTN